MNIQKKSRSDFKFVNIWVFFLPGYFRLNFEVSPVILKKVLVQRFWMDGRIIKIMECEVKSDSPALFTSFLLIIQAFSRLFRNPLLHVSSLIKKIKLFDFEI